MATATEEDITSYCYKAPWPLYALSWSRRAEYTFRVAVGSYLEEYRNKVEVLLHLQRERERLGV